MLIIAQPQCYSYFVSVCFHTWVYLIIQCLTVNWNTITFSPKFLVLMTLLLVFCKSILPEFLIVRHFEETICKVGRQIARSYISCPICENVLQLFY